MKKIFFSTILLMSLVCFATQAAADGEPPFKQKNKYKGNLDVLTRAVCQLSGVVGNVPKHHPAKDLVGLPVTVHVLWEALYSEDKDREDWCHGGYFKVNVGGVTIEIPMSDVECEWSFDDNGYTGEVILTGIGPTPSPFSPTRLAWGSPIDPRAPPFTGLDELVVSGNCYLLSEEEIPPEMPEE